MLFSFALFVFFGVAVVCCRSAGCIDMGESVFFPFEYDMQEKSKNDVRVSSTGLFEKNLYHSFSVFDTDEQEEAISFSNTSIEGELKIRKLFYFSEGENGENGEKSTLGSMLSFDFFLKEEDVNNSFIILSKRFSSNNSTINDFDIGIQNRKMYIVKSIQNGTKVRFDFPENISFFTSVFVSFLNDTIDESHNHSIVLYLNQEKQEYEEKSFEVKENATLNNETDVFYIGSPKGSELKAGLRNLRIYKKPETVDYEIFVNCILEQNEKNCLKLNNTKCIKCQSDFYKNNKGECVMNKTTILGEMGIENPVDHSILFLPLTERVHDYSSLFLKSYVFEFNESYQEYSQIEGHLFDKEGFFDTYSNISLKFSNFKNKTLYLQYDYISEQVFEEITLMMWLNIPDLNKEYDFFQQNFNKENITITLALKNQQLMMIYSSGEINYFKFDSLNIEKGVWFHIAIVLSRTLKDGYLVRAVKDGSFFFYPTRTKSGFVTTSTPSNSVVVGSFSNHRKFDGGIAKLMVFNVSFSTSAISKFYECQKNVGEKCNFCWDSETCENCPNGYNKNEKSCSCESVSSGYFNSMECVVCEGDLYYNHSDKCVLCNRTFGVFSERIYNDSSPCACIIGSSLYENTCQCDLGYELRDGSCQKCNSSAYKDFIGYDNCIICPDGNTTEQNGSISKEKCKKYDRKNTERIKITQIIIGIVSCLSILIVLIIIISIYFSVKIIKKKNDSMERVLKDEAKKVEASININQDLYKIKYNELKIKEKIGSGGSSSIVYLALWNELPVAFKCFRLNDFSSDEKYGEFEKEVEIMCSISHPYLLRFYGATVSPPRVGIVMEHCPNGDLVQYIQKNPNLDEKMRLTFLFQVAQGLMYLHSRKIWHRDMKPENVLISNDLTVRIIDFGLSRIMDEISVSKTVSIGTTKYMSPEVALGEDYNEKVDVFSFGIMAFEVITGNFDPFGKSNNYKLEMKVASDPSFRPDIQEIKTENRFIYDLLPKCWSAKPSKRPSMKEIVKTLENFCTEKKNEGFEIDKL